MKTSTVSSRHSLFTLLESVGRPTPSKVFHVAPFKAASSVPAVHLGFSGRQEQCISSVHVQFQPSHSTQKWRCMSYVCDSDNRVLPTSQLQNDSSSKECSDNTALGFWGIEERVKLWEGKIGLREQISGNADAIVNQNDIKQRTDEWYELRQGRLTASSFSTALGFWGVDRRSELWEEKLGLRERFAGNPATEWGSNQEAGAVQRYQEVTGNVVQAFGFKIYQEGDDVQDWLGASPDGLIDEGIAGIYEKGGILEVKCPHNKGKPELCKPWLSVPYYYMPQIQGLMEILDRDWLDLYVWTMNGSTTFRVDRNPKYWALIFGVLSDFWWANVIPAKQALLLDKNSDVKIYRPATLHRLTSLIINESRRLAREAPLTRKDLISNL